MKVRTYPALYLPATRPSAAMWTRYWRQRHGWGVSPIERDSAKREHWQQLRSVLGLL